MLIALRITDLLVDFAGVRGLARGQGWIYHVKSMTLKAIIHKDESGGFWAEVPSLPGCVSQGETVDEVRSNIREAIEAWLEAGEPEDSVEDEIFEVAL